MTNPIAGIIALPTVSLCLILAGTAGAQAQAECPMANSSGPPVVQDQHIFCGEIVKKKKAVGFHSRYKGVDPINAADRQPVITGGTVGVAGTRSGKTPPPGIYTLNQFKITQDGRTKTKGFSTMFPDKCDQDSVLKAIRHAAPGDNLDGDEVYRGQSGPTCTADDGSEFDIIIMTNEDGEIRTAHPDY